MKRVPAARPVSFNVSRDDYAIVREIVDRAMQFEWASDIGRLDISMDLTATHANGCPLDFAKLLAAPDFDFTHDVLGIRRHIDRGTGELRDCFVPQCAKPEVVR